jgi:hypothetical protein
MALCQRKEAIFLALALTNVDEHPLAVDVAHFESQGLRNLSPVA